MCIRDSFSAERMRVLHILQEMVGPQPHLYCLRDTLWLVSKSKCLVYNHAANYKLRHQEKFSESVIDSLILPASLSSFVVYHKDRYGFLMSMKDMMTPKKRTMFRHEGTRMGDLLPSQTNKNHIFARTCSGGIMDPISWWHSAQFANLQSNQEHAERDSGHY
eukprot:TRINITY_DN10428_c0_g2_i1.p2 TRINITY_DN10428_c0_g2~~TRINITY_DN10428_c0_g2_i1.p2  ORF type:complete len:182 (-),score=37.89 TRINITY_DN10428_c0_g2_i1:159-644(-)